MGYVMKLRMLILLVACYSTVATAQDVYQSTDAEGNVIYTDQEPADGGLKLKLPPMNVLDPAKSMEIEAEAEQRPFEYIGLQIIAPQNDETFFIATNPVSIQIKVIPQVNSELGHRLQILLDDQVLTENQQSYVLQDADRGSHVISARILDKKRLPVITSKPVTIHIQKPFIRP
jgi:hypothetical protein